MGASGTPTPPGVATSVLPSVPVLQAPFTPEFTEREAMTGGCFEEHMRKVFVNLLPLLQVGALPLHNPVICLRR